MSDKGSHTWEMILHYHRCPDCGYIFESRKPYEEVMGRLEKEERCPRCTEKFLVSKERKPTFGPLIGDPQPVETEWGK